MIGGRGRSMRLPAHTVTGRAAEKGKHWYSSGFVLFPSLFHPESYPMILCGLH